jgi:hypothetical protein
MVVDFDAAQTAYAGTVYGDLSYIGARQLLTTRGLYRRCDNAMDCPHQDIIGPVSPVSGWETLYDFSSPARVGPSCEEWWSSGTRGLKLKLVTYMENERSDLMDSIGDTFTNWGTSIGVVNEDDRGDAIIQRALMNTGELIYNSNSQESDSEQGWLDMVVGTAAAVAGNGFMSLINGLIVDSLPLFQGYLLLVVVSLLPMVMVLSLYSPRPVIALAFFLMAILLWSGLWEIARWVDNVLLASIFDDYAFMGLDAQMNGPAAILSILSMLGYFLIPLYFSRMLVVVGMDAAVRAQEQFDSMQQGTQASVNKGLGSIVGGGRNMGKEASKKIKNRLNR